MRPQNYIETWIKKDLINLIKLYEHSLNCSMEKLMRKMLRWMEKKGPSTQFQPRRQIYEFFFLF